MELNMINRFLSIILSFILLTISSGFPISNANTMSSVVAVQEVGNIKWNSCKNNLTFQCGFLSVPKDYSNPQSGFLSLPVSMHKATKERWGYLFFNFGGPWANNVAVLPSLTNMRLSNLIKEHFDLVTFDPRGVSPNTILCQSNNMDQVQTIQQELKKLVLNPLVNQNERSIYQLTNKMQNLCQYNSLYRYVSTKNTIQDLDQLRKVLHVDKINFYGASYGSRLGLAYLLQYPNHVNKMILDANLPPNNDFKEFVASRAKGASETYQSFFNYCTKAKNNCPYYANYSKPLTPQLLENEYNKLLKQSEHYGIPTSEKYYNRPFSANMLANLIYTEMDASIWPQLAKGLSQASSENNADQLMELYISQTGYNPKLDSYETDQRAATRAAVLCKDYNITNDLMNEKSWLQFVDNIKNNYSSAGSTASAWLSPICINWPAQSEPLLPENPHPVQSASPVILLIGNAEDPMMPFENSEKLAAYLKKLNIKVHVLKWNAFSHTALLTNSPLSVCVFKKVDDFLSNDLLPEQSECNDWANPFHKEI